MRRRDRVIDEIIVYLATKSTGEIENILHKALPPPHSQGQEFDRWVSLILGADLSNEPNDQFSRD